METTDLSLKIVNRSFYFGIRTGTAVKVEKEPKSMFMALRQRTPPLAE